MVSFYHDEGFAQSFLHSAIDHHAQAASIFLAKMPKEDAYSENFQVFVVNALHYFIGSNAIEPGQLIDFKDRVVKIRQRVSYDFLEYQKLLYNLAELFDINELRAGAEGCCFIKGLYGEQYKIIGGFIRQREYAWLHRKDNVEDIFSKIDELVKSDDGFADLLNEKLSSKYPFSLIDKKSLQLILEAYKKSKSQIRGLSRTIDRFYNRTPINYAISDNQIILAFYCEITEESDNLTQF